MTDVAKKIFPTKTGTNGAAYVAPNGLKIVNMDDLDKLAPRNSTPPSYVHESGRLTDRFDDPRYYAGDTTA